jgi:hypothetical protein
LKQSPKPVTVVNEEFMRQSIQFALALLVLSVAASAQPAITLTKSFGAATIPVGGSTTLAITISANANVMNVSFADTLPFGLVVSTPNGLVTSCGGTITAVAGSNSISMGPVNFGAGGECTVIVNVTGITPGLQLNDVVLQSSAGPFVAEAFIIVVAAPLPGAAPVATEADGVYQVRYLSNLLIGDSYVNLTNTGVYNGFDPAGRICVNVYVFDPSEELISCCACPVTPDGLVSLSAKQDLVSNTLTPGVPGSVIVKLVSTFENGGPCSASFPDSTNLVKGMKAWATTLHQNTTNGSYAPSDTEFAKSDLSATELSKLTQYCGFIQSNGSTFGICKSCRFGGLGEASQ